MAHRLRMTALAYLLVAVALIVPAGRNSNYSRQINRDIYNVHSVEYYFLTCNFQLWDKGMDAMTTIKKMGTEQDVQDLVMTLWKKVVIS